MLYIFKVIFVFSIENLNQPYKLRSSCVEVMKKLEG